MMVFWFFWSSSPRRIFWVITCLLCNHSPSWPRKNTCSWYFIKYEWPVKCALNRSVGVCSAYTAYKLRMHFFGQSEQFSCQWTRHHLLQPLVSAPAGTDCMLTLWRHWVESETYITYSNQEEPYITMYLFAACSEALLVSCSLLFFQETVLAARDKQHAEEDMLRSQLQVCAQLFPIAIMQKLAFNDQCSVFVPSAEWFDTHEIWT